MIRSLALTPELRTQVETYQATMRKRDQLAATLDAASEASIDALLSDLTEAQDQAERAGHAIADAVATAILGGDWRTA